MADVQMLPKAGDRVKVIWVGSGTRNEKVFNTQDEADTRMNELEQEGATYFWEWCK